MRSSNHRKLRRKGNIILTTNCRNNVDNVRAYNEAKYKSKRAKERLDKAETDRVNAIADGTGNDDI